MIVIQTENSIGTANGVDREISQNEKKKKRENFNLIVNARESEIKVWRNADWKRLEHAYNKRNRKLN